MTSHTRQQHSVGQGGFHTGWVRVDSDAQEVPRSVRYVYDCGSTRTARALAREIDGYIAADRSPIDLLFISHTDADHVNGLPRLLDQGRGLRVRTIVMPLVSTLERLVSWIEASETDARADFFESFVADPVGTLDERFAPDQILLVDGNRGPDEDAGLDDQLDVDGFSVTGAGPRYGASGRADGRQVSSSIRFTLHANDGEWVFAPHVDPNATNQLSAFEAKLADRLGVTVSELRDKLRSTSAVRDLLIEARAELQDAYRASGLSTNGTSLSLYVGPTHARTMERCLEVHLKQWTSVESRVGWLGTGDAEFGRPDRIAALDARLTDLLPLVGVISTPHHGSSHNFSPLLFDTVGDQLRLAVTSADPPKHWRHPSTELMVELASRGMHHVLVTSSPESGFRESYVDRI